MGSGIAEASFLDRFLLIESTSCVFIFHFCLFLFFVLHTVSLVASSFLVVSIVHLYI
jgi:fumarate reductase subunit C